MMQFQQLIFFLVLMDGTGAGNAELFNNTPVSKQWPIASYVEGRAGNTSGHSADQLDFVVVSPMDAILAKINVAMKSKLDAINGQLGFMLAAKDPMTINKSRGIVNFNTLSGISTLQIGRFEVRASNPSNPSVITISLSGNWVSLKIVGDALRHAIAIELQTPSFHSDDIIAHLDPKTGLIQKFDVFGVHANLGPTQVNIEIRMRFIRRIIEKKVNEKLQEKKGEIENQLGLKIQGVLAMILNGKTKEAVNKKLKEKAQ